MPIPPMTCPDCGVEFQRRSVLNRRCVDCQRKRNRVAQRGGTEYTTDSLVPNQCTDCGAWFQAKRAGAKYCPKCRASNHRKARRENMRARSAGLLEPKPQPDGCMWCGAVTQGERYCGDACRDAMRSDEDRAAENLRKLEREQERRLELRDRPAFRASSLAEAEATKELYNGGGWAACRENALTGSAPASMFRGIRKGV